MKEYVIKYKDVFCINISATLLGILVYLLVGNNPELSVAIIAAGISISFGIRQYKIENDKIFKELFIAFNQKYDEKYNNRLNDIIKECQQNENYEMTNDEKNLIVDYLNFCAEEYLWYKKDRIDESVWLSWENGMKYYFGISPIKAIVDQEKTQKDSYYGLFDRL